MNLGQVIGTVVADQKYEGLEGVRLLVVQPLDSKRAKVGSPIVACDCVQAGPGEVIWFVNSREASLGLENTFVPVDATIVGHVDAIGDSNVELAFDERGA